MGRGKRYNDEQKLNIKKVIAVLVAIVVIVMFFIGIKNLLTKNTQPVDYFSDVSYLVSYENGKWGVINSKGENVINPEYGEMIEIPDSKRDIFICTYEVNYSDNTYKTEAINSNKSKLFTDYNSVEVLSNYDQNGNVWNEENVLKVKKGDKYGLINLDGAEVLSCNYDKVETLKGIKNSIVVQKDGLYGLVNNNGERIIDNLYTEISALTDEYTNGYVVKNSDSKYGIIGVNKEQLLECKYEEIKHVCGDNLYVAKLEGKWIMTNKAGDKTTDIAFEDVTYLGSDAIVVKSNGNYGIYGMDKSEKVKPEYQYIEYAFSDKYIAKKDDKYGIINTLGEVLVPFEYSSLSFSKEADSLLGNKAGDDNTYLVDRNLEVKATAKNITVYDGYIRVNVNGEYKFYNLKFEEKTDRDAFANNTLYVAKNDGKFGLVNKDGTLVVNYEYDDITEQNKYGYVAVKKDGKWGVIDSNGNVCVEPKYEFQDVSKVTFIGKWHSVENVNTAYFVCE